MSVRLRLNDSIEINIGDHDGDLELVPCDEIDELRLKADLWDAKARVAAACATAFTNSGRVSISKARLRHLEAQAKKLANVMRDMEVFQNRRFPTQDECVVKHNELAELRRAKVFADQIAQFKAARHVDGTKYRLVRESWYAKISEALLYKQEGSS